MLSGPALDAPRGSKIFSNPQVSLGKTDTICPGNLGCKIWFLFLTGFPASWWVPVPLKPGLEVPACQRSHGTLSTRLTHAVETETDSQDRTDTSEWCQHAYVKANKKLRLPAGYQLLYLWMWHWCRHWNITFPFGSSMQDIYWKTANQQRIVARRMTGLEK